MQRTSLFAVSCVLLTAFVAVALETTTGSIAGRVVDAQDLALPGATVAVVTPQGQHSFVTDSEGRFFAPFLTPGQYEVDVDLQGFRPLHRSNIDVRLGQPVDLRLSMELGVISETVTVTGAAPGAETSSTSPSIRR